MFHQKGTMQNAAHKLIILTIKILFTIPTFPAYLLSILYFVKIAVSEAEAKACA